MSRKQRNFEQLDLLAAAMEPTITTPEANLSPIDKELAPVLGKTAVSGTVEAPTPLHVDLKTRYSSMVEALDGLDNAVGTAPYAAAVHQKEARKPYNDPRPFFKLMNRKRNPMTEDQIYEKAAEHKEAMQKVDESFAKMYGIEQVEQHGKVMGNHPEYTHVPMTEIVLTDLVRDKNGYGTIQDNGKNMITHKLADGSTIVEDSGSVEDEGFMTKFTAGDRLNPAVRTMMTPRTEKQASSRRKAQRKFAQDRLKELEAPQLEIASSAKAASISRAEARVKLGGLATKAKDYIKGPEPRIATDYQGRMQQIGSEMRAKSEALRAEQSPVRRPVSMQRDKTTVRSWGRSQPTAKTETSSVLEVKIGRQPLDGQAEISELELGRHA